MYILLCVLLSALYIILAVAKFFIKSEKWAKISFIVSIAAGASGVILSVFTAVKAIIKLSDPEDIKDSEAVSWVRDAFSGYLKDVLPVFAVIVILLLLSSLIQPKKMFLRAVITCASSVLSLIYGYITVFLTENGTFSISFEIKAVSISLSLLLTSFCIFDFYTLKKGLSKEKTNKNQKIKHK